MDSFLRLWPLFLLSPLWNKQLWSWHMAHRTLKTINWMQVPFYCWIHLRNQILRSVLAYQMQWFFLQGADPQDPCFGQDTERISESLHPWTAPPHPPLAGESSVQCLRRPKHMLQLRLEISLTGMWFMQYINSHLIKKTTALTCTVTQTIGTQVT